jgi:predicted permease
MHWLRRFFQKEKSEKQLDAELRFHLEQQIANHVAAGMPPVEARRRAQLEFGGLEPIKEDCREARRGNFLESVLQDLRYGSRMLRKSPGFTLAAAATLALGIGANTAIFSIVNAVILRPLPYKDSSRIVSIATHTALFPTFSLGLTWPDLQQIRSQANSLEEVAAYTDQARTLTGKGEPTILSVDDVSDSFFTELGVTAQLGRLLTEQDLQPGQEHVIVIGDALWRNRFGAQTNAIGQSLTLDRLPYTIVGVAPHGFVFPEKVDAWIPLALSAADKENHTYFMLQVLGKLRPGATIASLSPQLDTIAQRNVKDFPALGGGYSFSTLALLEQRVSSSRNAYLMLLGAATLVLMISCANLASLLLARGSGRQREMALRAALGASRSKLLRQGLVESCLLGLFGGILGVMLAAQAISLFRAIAPPDTPRLVEVSVDATLLWVSLVTSLIAGVLFGIVPAYRASRMDPNDALKEGTGASLGAARSTGQSRLGQALVVVEVALAFVLIVGSTLMTLSVFKLLHQNPGFRTDHLLTFDLPQAPSTGTESETSAAIGKQFEDFKTIIDMVGHVAGVAAVTASDHGLLIGMSMMQSNLIVDNAIPSRAGETRAASARYVFPSYFDVMGIPLLRGREFTDHDSGPADRVVIVSEAMAREYWGTLDVIGKRLSMSQDEKGKPLWHTVIGVASDTRDVHLRSQASPGYYLSFFQGGTGSIHLLVRTLNDPEPLARTISRQIWSSYPDQPVSHVMTMSKTISESVGDERLRSTLLIVFAAVGFALSLVGVYGVISYSVSRRSQEIGIRMALGAGPSDVLRLILQQGLLPVVLGIVFGAAGALALTRLLASQFYGIQPSDPMTFVAAAVLVLIVACLACFVPARRAAHVDPLNVLHYE